MKNYEVSQRHQVEILQQMNYDPLYWSEPPRKYDPPWTYLRQRSQCQQKIWERWDLGQVQQRWDFPLIYDVAIRDYFQFVHSQLFALALSLLFLHHRLDDDSPSPCVDRTIHNNEHCCIQNRFQMLCDHNSSNSKKMKNNFMKNIF